MGRTRGGGGRQDDGCGGIRIEGIRRGWEGRVGPFEVKTLLFPDVATSAAVETDIPELNPTE